MRRELYGQFLAEAAHRRELSRLRSVVEHGDADHVDEFTTSSWTPGPATNAEVTVTVTLFNYADVVLETLDSIAASSEVNFEIVVVDDRSSDNSVEVVRAWMADHDHVPMLLVASAVNRGLARARNLAIDRARAEFVMIMDADNHVYPTCLRRLADALNHDTDAAMAYATLEAFGPTPGLRSAQGWHVPWLCEKNYIDAQSLMRRSVLERYHGYLLDDFMYGWEDWEMWLRFAANGDYGVHVPELLGRYRTQLSSMISLTNLAADDLRADLRRRYPDLPWP